MTNHEKFVAAIEVAVGYGIAHGLARNQIVEGLVIGIAAVIAPAKFQNPDLDLDPLLEIVRHQLDTKTAAILAANREVT